jgi:hypothetical protein
MPGRTPKGTRYGGRGKGVPNKATATAREAVALFIDDNAPRLQAWLDEIANTDGPRVAFQCVLELLEYHIPKLARTELTGKEGEDIVARFVVETHDGPPPRQEIAGCQTPPLGVRIEHA